MQKILSLVATQTQGLSGIDQLLYIFALIAPFCGIVLGTTFWFNLRGALRYILSWIAPGIWIVSLIGIISQLPSKEYLLLISAIALSLPLTLLYYTVIAILSLANLKDTLQDYFYKPPQPKKQKSTETPNSPHAQPLPLTPTHVREM